MSEKQFKTYDELLQLLVARGVDASTAQLRNYAKKCFQNEGYYNLINGYKQLFIKPKESLFIKDKKLLCTWESVILF